MFKKNIAIVLTVTTLILSSGYMYFKENKDNGRNSDEVSREREYQVKRGDIIAGINGSGVLKFEQVTQNFDEPVMIGSIAIKEGQRIKKGDEIASISIKYLDEKLKELNDKLKELNSNNEENSDIDSNLKSEISKTKNEISKIKKLKKSPTIYAKTSGIVFEVGYSIGEMTSSEKPVVKIGEDTKTFVEVNISQNEIIKLEKGQDVYVLVSAYDDEKLTGKVSFINLKPNNQGNSTNYSVIVELDENEFNLLDGMTASAQFIIKELKDVLMLSNKAITLKDGKQTVKVKQEDKTLKEVEIVTGFSDGKNSEIISGLSDGDVVVVGGE